MNEHDIAQVRRFNRTVTQRIGALSDDYLGAGRPLGEARLLFEIGQAGADGATVRDLRAQLGLDSGYFSRLLRTLEAQQLAASARDVADARVRRVTLTAAGQALWAQLDERSRGLATSLLGGLGVPQRARLLAAMAEVERLLQAGAVVVEEGDPAGADVQACFAAYFQELQALFDGGFDPARSVSADPSELRAPQGCCLVARLDGRVVGCAALKRVEADAAGPVYGEVKRMWVAPDARGLGVAARLLQALENRAAAAGLDLLRLDTHRDLVAARALYQRHGYVEIARYNDNPYADHWFEKRLG